MHIVAGNSSGYNMHFIGGLLIEAVLLLATLLKIICNRYDRLAELKVWASKRQHCQ